QDMTSKLTQDLLKLMKSKHVNCEKLVPNLRNKTNYVCHYRTLQYYLTRGMILKKVNRIISFDQSPWMKDYIDLNTNKRKEAKSSFEKDFYKLLNNAVFGKTMEDVRKR